MSALKSTRPGKALRLLNRVLHRLETRPVSGDPRAEFIFLVGPPRSGTTLLFQLVCRHLEVGYFSNRHARYYGGISYRERLLGHAAAEGIDYNSQYGLTTGPSRPA